LKNFVRAVPSAIQKILDENYSVEFSMLEIEQTQLQIVECQQVTAAWADKGNVQLRSIMCNAEARREDFLMQELTILNSRVKMQLLLPGLIFYCEICKRKNALMQAVTLKWCRS
jgi:hypothetical protein